jgi:hypothetical protein
MMKRPRSFTSVRPSIPAPIRPPSPRASTPLDSPRTLYRTVARSLAIVLVGCGLTASLSAQTVTQTITLQPGWNAVWLEVQPEENSTDAVFASLPVASVWTRLERRSSVDFIQDVSEEAFNEAGWQRWLPPAREESFLNNLFAVQANRAYLIRVEQSAPVVWTITGRPALRRPAWVPDSFNLRGAPVDPVEPPTFVNFFRHSTAHYQATTGQLQPIYRLHSASGQWQRVGANDLMRGGEAYWILTHGASDYLAPLEPRVDLGDGLDFGLELTELNLRLRNRKSTPVTALLTDPAGVPNGILSHYVFDPQLGGQWPPLPAPLALPIEAGAELRVRLAARRQHQPSSLYQSVIEVRDGAGTRLQLPVNVEKFTAGTASGALVPMGGSGLHTPRDEAMAMAGLWVGVATINAVSEAHSANPTVPTPTRSELNLRLVLHVDESGQTRLLKEVIQMWRDGTYTTNADGDRVVDQPGEYVLLTDDSLIPSFQGAALRDGVSAGRRVSTIGYDFAADSAANFLNLSGFFAINESLSGTLSMPHDHPTNPFKHRYHPDHDNLNERFDGPAVEAYATTRQIELSFTASPTNGPAVPDFGYNEMGGTYSETITGIHKNAIHVSGTFRLTRVSFIAQLNPNPNP